jgi:hypothetical protein
MSTNITTNHDNDEDEEEQAEPKLSDKKETMERIRWLKANGVVFQSYGDSIEPERTVFDTRGGLFQRGTFGMS